MAKMLVPTWEDRRPSTLKQKYSLTVSASINIFTDSEWLFVLL
jgi:hypothetical protein